MQKKYILATALVAGAFALPAFAGAVVTTPASKPVPSGDCPLSGSVMGGYNSTYAYRGMIAGEGADKLGCFEFGASLGYKTSGGFQFFVEGVDRLSSLNHVNGSLSGSGIPFNIVDETHTTLTAGVAYEMAPNLTASVGYNYQKGGMPGLFSAFNTATYDADGFVTDIGQDHTQEIFLGLSYDATESLRLWVQGVYDFDALEGWYVGAGASYTHKLSDRVSLVLTVDTAYTFDYWVDDSGWNHIGATLELPVQVCSKMTIAPYIAYTEALDLGQDISEDYFGRGIIDDDGFSAGLRATVSF